MFYLKYIFYLSDKVICYSLSIFKSNKKNFDALFSKFRKKEEKWEFDEEKIICKLCLFKLINKLNFIEKIKKIFLYKENEKSFNINYGDIVIELNSDGNQKSKIENNNDENEKFNFIVEKINNKDTNKNHKILKEDKNIKFINNNINDFNYFNDRCFVPFNNYNNPNCLNIYNSNNININIKNNNKIINNFFDNKDYNSLFYLCNNIKNNNTSIRNLQSKEVNFYWQQLFFYNHNKILNFCEELKNEICNLRNLIYYLNSKDNKDKVEKENINYQMIIEKSRDRTLFLLNEILFCIEINHNYINEFLNDLNLDEKDNKNNISNLINLLNENYNNKAFIHQIYLMYKSIINVYLYKLDNNELNKNNFLHIYIIEKTYILF